MFSKTDLLKLSTAEIKEHYDVRIQNAHDITLHSKVTGHDWVIVSGFDTAACTIMHRHSSREPYHHQAGRYKGLEEAQIISEVMMTGSPAKKADIASENLRKCHETMR